MKVLDKNIIVTGAGAGVGKELTLQLLKKGATVIAIDINDDALEELKKKAKSKKLYIYKVDVASDISLNNFKVELMTSGITVDGIINNAGIIQPFLSFKKLKMDTIYKVMNVNFYGPLKLTKLFLDELLEKEEAHIVNVSSMGGFFPFPTQTIYGASKAALKLFTEGLYAELLDTNVKVTLVFPGAIATDIAKNSKVKIKKMESQNNFKMLLASNAASIIIEGMEKNHFKVYAGTDAKIMNILYKINDKFAIKMINKLMKKVM